MHPHPDEPIVLHSFSQGPRCPVNRGSTEPTFSALDCSQQYKSWTSDETVSCLVQMDPQLEASVTVKGGCHHVSKQVKYAPQCTRKRFRKVQYHHSLKFANNSNSKIPKNNLVEHTNPFLRTSALSDPFDDFIVSYRS